MQFLEKLVEVFRTYTIFDPKARENQSAVKVAFLNQEAPDSLQKFHHLEGFEGKQLTELFAGAERVYNNRETLQGATKQGLAKILLSAANQDCTDDSELKDMAERQGRGNQGTADGDPGFQ